MDRGMYVVTLRIISLGRRAIAIWPNIYFLRLEEADEMEEALRANRCIENRQTQTSAGSKHFTRDPRHLFLQHRPSQPVQ